MYLYSLLWIIMAKYINPYTDFGFKKLFGEEGSKEQLKDFLNELLPPIHKIKDLSFKKTEQLPENENARKAIFDIYCEAEECFRKAEIANYNQKERDQYEASLKVYRDLKGVIDTSFHDGIKKGIDIGIDIAIRKAKKKFSAQEIAEMLDVPIKRVNEIEEDTID